MKQVFLTLLFLLFITICYSQNSTIDSLKQTTSVVIKASKTTDPNYQINKAKSEQVKKQLAIQPTQVLKDDNYYLTNIELLKYQIAKIKTQPNAVGVNPDKMEALKVELNTLEADYQKFQKK